MVLGEAELREMAASVADCGLEISLFVGPREEWGIGAHVPLRRRRAVDGEHPRHAAVAYALEDVLRAVDCGIRGFLVADLGLQRVLWTPRTTARSPPTSSGRSPHGRAVQPGHP